MIFILSLYIVLKNCFFLIQYIFKDITNKLLVQYNSNNVKNYGD